MKKIIKTKLSYIIDIPRIVDEGYLCFMEGDNHIPFPIKRIYYIFDVIKNAVRGRHAHKNTKQVLFCIKGSITIILDNGTDKEAITLNNPNHGIFLDRMIWHEMVAFAPDTILLVVTSDYFDERDYIRDYKTFLEHVERKKHDSNE